MQRATRRGEGSQGKPADDYTAAAMRPDCPGGPTENGGDWASEWAGPDVALTSVASDTCAASNVQESARSRNAPMLCHYAPLARQAA